MRTQKKVESVSVVLLAAALLLDAPACAPRAASFAWHDPLALRSMGPRGTDLRPASIIDDPDAVLGSAHYTKLAATRVFLREVGLAPGETALVGFSLRGALPGGALLQGVSEPVTVDAQGGLELKPSFAVEAFAYASELTLELTVLRVDSAAADAARKARAEAPGTAAPLWPYDEPAVSAGRALFAATIGLPRAGQRRWSTSVSLRAPRRGVLGPVLIAGRSVVFFQPPPEAPAALREGNNLRTFATKLRLLGEVPSWNEANTAFREAPYLVLVLERPSRLGWMEHPAYRKLAESDAHLEAAASGTAGRLEKAEAALREVPQAALTPDVFTAAEKDFLKTLIELRRLRLAITEAAQKQDSAELHLQRGKLAERLEALTGGRYGRTPPMPTEAEAAAFSLEATRLRNALKPSKPE